MNTKLSAPDIHCDGCANAIRRALGLVTGVSDVAVDIAAKTVVVEHGETTTAPTLIAALDRAGFLATVVGASGTPAA